MRPCSKCGAMLKPYFLKDGICNGCRNPHLIVEAKTERFTVEQDDYCCWVIDTLIGDDGETNAAVFGSFSLKDCELYAAKLNKEQE